MALPDRENTKFLELLEQIREENSLSAQKTIESYRKETKNFTMNVTKMGDVVSDAIYSTAEKQRHSTEHLIRTATSIKKMNKVLADSSNKQVEAIDTLRQVVDEGNRTLRERLIFNLKSFIPGTIASGQKRAEKIQAKVNKEKIKLAIISKNFEKDTFLELVRTRLLLEDNFFDKTKDKNLMKEMSIEAKMQSLLAGRRDAAESEFRDVFSLKKSKLWLFIGAGIAGALLRYFAGTNGPFESIIYILDRIAKKIDSIESFVVGLKNVRQAAQESAKQSQFVALTKMGGTKTLLKPQVGIRGFFERFFPETTKMFDKLRQNGKVQNKKFIRSASGFFSSIADDIIRLQKTIREITTPYTKAIKKELRLSLEFWSRPFKAIRKFLTDNMITRSMKAISSVAGAGAGAVGATKLGIFVTGFGKFGGFITKLLSSGVFKSFVGMVKIAGNAAGKVLRIAGKVFFPITVIFGAIDALGGALRGMGMADELGVNKIIGGFVGGLAGVIDFLTFGALDFEYAMKEIAPNLQKIVTGIREANGPQVIDGILGTISGIASTAWDTMKNIWKMVGEGLLSISDWLVKAFKLENIFIRGEIFILKVGNFISNLFNGIVSVFSEGVPALLNIVGRLFTSVTTRIYNAMVNGVNEMLDSMIQDIDNSLIGGTLLGNKITNSLRSIRMLGAGVADNMGTPEKFGEIFASEISSAMQRAAINMGTANEARDRRIEQLERSMSEDMSVPLREFKEGQRRRAQQTAQNYADRALEAVTGLFASSTQQNKQILDGVRQTVEAVKMGMTNNGQTGGSIIAPVDFTNTDITLTRDIMSNVLR